MNFRAFRFWAPLAIATALFLTNLTLNAEPAAAANLLRQAYATLAAADHDYKGHRIEAMKQVELAAKLLHEDIRGDGKGHEKQGVSDEQLRAARAILERARGQLSGKALKHVDRAINQIDTALKIR